LQRAIEEGADFIETDILASKDGHLICFHDVTLDATTDIADRAEFAGRRRTYEVERENVTGWFVGMRNSDHIVQFSCCYFFGQKFCCYFCGCESSFDIWSSVCL
jgi:glycerophosphoryl diester phosphodiesterase